VYKDENLMRQEASEEGVAFIQITKKPDETRSR